MILNSSDLTSLALTGLPSCDLDRNGREHVIVV